MSMVTCRWSAHRIQRYLDGDPAAPLRPREVRRLEAHLAVCTRCSAVLEEHRRLRGALGRWTRGAGPSQDSVARVQGFLRQLTEAETP